jgi:DNA-directed RNA polymerase subunit M/transcription elongation factor TFIIS
MAGILFQARPTEFDYDNNRQPISIKKIVTTCPKCSSYNEYDVDIKDNVGVFIFKCKNCESDDKSKPIELIDNKITVTKTEPKKSEIKIESTTDDINIIKSKSIELIDNKIAIIKKPETINTESIKNTDQDIKIINIKEDVKIINIKEDVKIINAKTESDFVDPIALGLFNVEQI